MLLSPASPEEPVYTRMWPAAPPTSSSSTHGQCGEAERDGACLARQQTLRARRHEYCADWRKAPPWICPSVTLRMAIAGPEFNQRQGFKGAGVLGALAPRDRQKNGRCFVRTARRRRAF